MEIILDIPDKMYNEIMEMCVYNNIVLDDYLLDCIFDNFNLMKYDDLNEKLNKKEEKIETPKVEEKPNEVTEKKKVGRPRKKNVATWKDAEAESLTLLPETIEKGPNPPIMINSWEEFDKVYLDKKEENKEQPKITKRTRVLKTR